MNISRRVIKRISPYMKSKGFMLSKNNYYYISNDIAYCLALDTPGGLLYVTAYIMPLYIPCEGRYYTYGRRLNELQENPMPLLTKNDNEDSIDRWCDKLYQCLENVIIPFYHQTGTPSKLANYAEHKNSLSASFFFCPQVFIERLKMYTYLYTNDYNKAIVALNNYRKQLETCTFLTVAVREQYSEEINTTELLLGRNDFDIPSFYSPNLENTRKVLMQ